MPKGRVSPFRRAVALMYEDFIHIPNYIFSIYHNLNKNYSSMAV